MATPSAQLDQAGVEARVREVVRELLRELGSQRGLEELARRGGGAHLGRDLGLGSLERVELLLRLHSACGVHLPDEAVAEADTVNDLVGTILRLGPDSDSAGGDTVSPGDRYRPAGTDAAPAQHDEPGHGLDTAETLTEVLRHRGRFSADRAHIHLCEEDGKTRTITYGELYAGARVMAAGLVRRGLEPGGTVAIMLPTCADFFFSFFGILLAGGIPVPIYPPFRADRIEEYAARQAGILRNAEAQFLITFRQAEGLARLLGPDVPSLREVLNATRLAAGTGLPEPPKTEVRPVEGLPHRARGSDIAFLQYTSGSTGDPKGVILTHANLLANIRSIGKAVALRPDDVAVSWLPLYHDMGLIGAWFVPLYFSVPLVVLSPLAFLSRPERWLWAIHHHRGTISPAPNFAYELCVRKIADPDIAGLDLSSWRAALNGAEPVNPETLERFAERFKEFGLRREVLLPVYGLAEATLGVAAPAMGSGAKVDRIDRDAFEREGRAVPAAPGRAALQFVSAGQAFPGVEIQLLDAEGRPVSERIQGRLWFRGPSATSGYYRNPDATREILREGGWVDSGDLAYLADGELYITGRAKDIIIKGGRNLSPQEVEALASRTAGVRAGCVVAFGVADARTGTERLVIAAEVRDLAGRDRVITEMMRNVADGLGMPPDIIELLPPHSIPKTSSGKLRRAETRRLYLAGKLDKAQPPTWIQVARLAARTAVPRSAARARKAIRRAGEIAYGVYALLVVAVLIPLLWAAVLLSPSGRTAARIARRIARLILVCAGVPVRVENAELLSQLERSGPWIFAPNHSSYLDIVVATGFLPVGARFVAKGEVGSMPLLGKVARRIGHFTFDRSNPQARLAQTAAVEEALRRGESVVIYPEGTFTSAAGVRPFQLGAFKAAVDTGRPICPVAVRGAREILRDETYLPRSGRITVTFGPLLQPAGSDWHEIVRLRDTTREIISGNIAEPLL